MKVPALLVPVCLLVFFFGPACSREDQPAGPAPSPKVVQTILPSQEPKETPPTETAQKPQEMPVTDPPRAASPAVLVKEEPGIYVVKEGDTLTGIAARREILEDPLKWPILLRWNRDKLRDQPMGPDFPARELPAGMKLRFITPREAGERLGKGPATLWVVNVMSASTPEEIIPHALILAREGYPAYIVRAQVKGKEYLRLRVGFFDGKGEAAAQGEKIKSLLGVKEYWATRADEAEYRQVAGFLKAS